MATHSINNLLNGRTRHTILNGNYILSEIVRSMTTLKAPRFVSFIYENEYEISAVTILVGANLENAYRRDLAVLEELNRHESHPVNKLAINEMMESLKESLEKGIGNNSRYTNKGVYTHVEGNNGSVKVHDDKGMVYLTGTVIRKRVLVKLADRKQVNSSEKTLAKNRIKRDYCKMTSFRQYKLDATSLTSISFDRNKVVFNADKYNKAAKISKEYGRALTEMEYRAL